MREHIRSETLKRLYAYWDEKRGGRPAPARADIDPLEMRAFLPHVFLMDVEGPPWRYRIRLMGTAFRDQYGEDVTGRYLDEIDLGEERDRILASYEELIETVSPSRMSGQYKKADGRIMWYERLTLPLSSDGKTVDKILGGIVSRRLDDE